jgi:hypothetical protein
VNSGQIWPEHFNSDYKAAAVRLTTIMQRREQHLLFGCVELYPHEIPLPPPDVTPLRKRIGDATLVSGIAVMQVPEAIAWYESALGDWLKVPGIPADVNVITCELAPEPALGRLVAGGELPFATRWHCGPRMHHLVPLGDAPASIAWLAPDSKTEVRAKAREWLAETLGFDLLAYDEFLFGLVLLAPNPIARSIGTHIKGSLPGGGERLGVTVRARRGASLADVHVRFREERSEGTTVVIDRQLDSFGQAEIDLPEPCSRSGLEILSGRHGVIGIEGPASFFRSVQVRSEVLGSRGTVAVPGRRTGATPAAYPIVRREQQRAFGGKQPAPRSAELRSIELRTRRLTRVGEARPEGFGQRADGEEQLFLGGRATAVLFVRNLVARAQNIAVFVDPYFNHIDVREFALATQYQDVAVHVLVGRGENLWQGADAGEGEQGVAGDVFAADLRALAEDLRPSGLAIPDVRLMGDDARTYHDRFLVIDDTVWHFGHSFNQVGEAEVSMATRLRYPDEIRAWIIEDIARASPFLVGWPVIKARRESEKPAPRAGIVGRAWTALNTVISAAAGAFVKRRKLGDAA